MILNNRTTEHDTTKLITSFHSESTVHSNDISISCYKKLLKIGENPLIIDLPFYANLAVFSKYLKQ